mmetsp:Transcript_18518/g.60309  ORF Transcript_18518/g.60309 Transcript_18518/m.60309 type:complete len:343 (+) Transcript_18518:443-1471(+)
MEQEARWHCRAGAHVHRGSLLDTPFKLMPTCVFEPNIGELMVWHKELVVCERHAADKRRALDALLIGLFKGDEFSPFGRLLLLVRASGVGREGECTTPELIHDVPSLAEDHSQCRDARLVICQQRLGQYLTDALLKVLILAPDGFDGHERNGERALIGSPQLCRTMGVRAALAAALQLHLKDALHLAILEEIDIPRPQNTRADVLPNHSERKLVRVLDGCGAVVRGCVVCGFDVLNIRLPQLDVRTRQQAPIEQLLQRLVLRLRLLSPQLCVDVRLPDMPRHREDIHELFIHASRLGNMSSLSVREHLLDVLRRILPSATTYTPLLITSPAPTGPAPACSAR